jgi:hypothetical protein
MHPCILNFTGRPEEMHPCMSLAQEAHRAPLTAAGPPQCGKPDLRQDLDGAGRRSPAIPCSIPAAQSHSDSGCPFRRGDFRLAWRLMTILPRPSVSPLPSFCHVRTDAVPRYMSFQETVGAIRRHLTGRPKPSMRELWLAEQAVERLAEEMEEAGTETTISQSHGRDESHG